MTADWQVITELLSSSRSPRETWGSGSRGWGWHHVARSERGYSRTRLPHISWRLKCWSRQTSQLPMHVGGNVSDCLPCRICFPWLPLAISGCCLHLQTAVLHPDKLRVLPWIHQMLEPFAGSDHQGLLPLSCVSNSTPSEDAGLQPPELCDTWGGTRDCCAPMWWHCLPRDLRHQNLHPTPAGNEDKMCLLKPRHPAAAHDNSWKWEKATEGQKKGRGCTPVWGQSEISCCGLSPSLQLCKTCPKWPPPWASPYILLLQTKNCTGCVLAWQGPSTLGKHYIHFF